MKHIRGLGQTRFQFCEKHGMSFFTRYCEIFMHWIYSEENIKLKFGEYCVVIRKRETKLGKELYIEKTIYTNKTHQTYHYKPLFELVSDLVFAGRV